MGSAKDRLEARLKRKKRIRKRVQGTELRPRLTVFRSAKHIYAQIIDDVKGKTIVAASSLEKEIKDSTDSEEEKTSSKIRIAKRVGAMVGKRAVEKGVSNVVFDRNGFMYHGRVKAVSDGAREAGLKF